MARTNSRATRQRPVNAEVLAARVTARTQFTPTTIRLTLTGPDLHRLTIVGADQWVRLFVPRHGQRMPALPGRVDLRGYLQYYAIASQERPRSRSYTIADYRNTTNTEPEVDIDIVTHGHPDDDTHAGWAIRSSIGDTIAILDQGRSFPLDTHNRPVLIVGDETALPAIRRILQDVPEDTTGTAVVTIAHAHDQEELSSPAHLDNRWHIRPDGHHLSEESAPHLGPLAPLSPHTLVWTAGEFSLVHQVRQLALQQGVPRSNIIFTGYYRLGRRS